ncbi:hypothetical protein [Micromonospora sp. CPCC 206061]|uniref:hypothetical protein n=1 Tax=Micromonospora sp. CPCC 206061 TaxID=3122410 RepID=UPI002FF33D41
MRNDTEDRAQDVRVLLEGAHVPPPRVDLERAVESGVRVKRRRWYAAAGGVTALAMVGTFALTQALGSPLAEGPDGVDTLVGDSAKPYSDCTVNALPMPDEQEFAGYVAADPTGRYAVGGVAGPNGETRPVLWTDGKPQVLKVRAKSAEARDVNAAGVVVGSATAETGREFAWLYRDGKVRELETPDLSGSVIARAITERGDVLGDVWTSRRSATVFWKGDDLDAVVQVKLPGDVGARDLDEDGAMVGGTQLEADGKAGRPMAWALDGAPKPLALPEGFTGGQATAVRGGWAVGWVSKAPPETTEPSVSRPGGVEPAAPANESQTYIPARWELATGAVTTWPDRVGPAEAVNAAGWVVLTSPPNGGSAAVVRDGQVYELDESENGFPMTLSDDGRRLYGMPIGNDRAGLDLLSWNC